MYTRTAEREREKKRQLRKRRAMYWTPLKFSSCGTTSGRYNIALFRVKRHFVRAADKETDRRFLPGDDEEGRAASYLKTVSRQRGVFLRLAHGRAGKSGVRENEFGGGLPCQSTEGECSGCSPISRGVGKRCGRRGERGEGG